ncbi:MAG: hypothetical protein ABL927_13350 [Bdellovibrionales bacterium]
MLLIMVPDNSNLLTALSHWTIDVVKHIYLTLNIPPTDEHLNCALQNTVYCYDILVWLANFKFLFTREHFDIVIKSHPSTELVELFMSYGVVLTKEDIVLLTRRHIELKDFHRFGFTVDDAFVEICANVNFYPPYVTNFTIHTLETACSFPNNLKIVKDIIKKSNLTPNIECLRQACRTGDSNIVRFLLKHVKPDDSCLNECQKNKSPITRRRITEQVIKALE